MKDAKLCLTCTIRTFKKNVFFFGGKGEDVVDVAKKTLSSPFSVHQKGEGGGGEKNCIVVDADTSDWPTYDASHPDESAKFKKKKKYEVERV